MKPRTVFKKPGNKTVKESKEVLEDGGRGNKASDAKLIKKSGRCENSGNTTGSRRFKHESITRSNRYATLGRSASESSITNSAFKCGTKLTVDKSVLKKSNSSTKLSSFLSTTLHSTKSRPDRQHNIEMHKYRAVQFAFILNKLKASVKSVENNMKRNIYNYWTEIRKFEDHMDSTNKKMSEIKVRRNLYKMLSFQEENLGKLEQSVAEIVDPYTEFTNFINQMSGVISPNTATINNPELLNMNMETCRSLLQSVSTKISKVEELISLTRNSQLAKDCCNLATLEIEKITTVVDNMKKFDEKFNNDCLKFIDSKFLSN